jgi:tetratricopeptide (TPR) repeat protein
VISGFLLIAGLFLLALSPALGDNPELQEAVALAVDGRFEEALSAFESLLGKEPESPLLSYYAGMACLRLKRLDRAISYLEYAIFRKAPFPQAYLGLGEAYIAKEKPAEARRVIEEGVNRFPRNPALRELRSELAGGT